MGASARRVPWTGRWPKSSPPPPPWYSDSPGPRTIRRAPWGVLIATLVFYGLTLLGSIAGLWPVDVRNGLLIAALSRGHAFPPQPEPHGLVKKRSSAGASLSFPPVRPSGHQGDHMHR